MFRNLLLLIFLFSFSLVSGQSDNEVYSKVQVSLEGKNIQDLVRLGVACDCGVRHAHGKRMEGVFSASELALLESNGWDYEVVIEDMAAYHRERGEPSVDFRGVCDGAPAEFEYPVPENFELGSLGGFLTYQHMLDELDAMAAQYPDLITVKEPIGPTLTHEGRPIYWVRISDNANVDEIDEPEVFYNAVHHAREPGGMIQMIYYMWYLLENYAADPEMQFLVDETEMYFVPCVNPDGYLFNEQNFSTGDVFWRKNRRDNGNGTFGVDLNRNYGFEWGFDNNGSSPNPESQTYRGPEAFSEPETQNIRDFCNAHQFQIALNYHTYGNLLIYPWGYSDQPTAESDLFVNLAGAMTRENNYFAGTGTETVGYTVNGDSDDWMYGENQTKPAIYSMTPEVGPGSEGFWPDENTILDIIQTTVQQNITMAHLVHNVGLAEITQEIDAGVSTGEVAYSLTKYGLQNAPITVSLAPISSNIQSVGSANSHDLTLGEIVDGAIEYTLNNNIPLGEEIVMELLIDNGEFIRRETLTAISGEGPSSGTPIITDNADDFLNWNNVQGNTWDITANDFISAPTSITDSPFGDYDDDIFNVMELTTELDLSTAESGNLNFWTKWEIEQGYDFVQIMLSSDGQNWTPGCGIYSVLGNNDQSPGEPLWDGTQADWVEEQIDLADYVGGPLFVRFQIISDGFINRDGFYFDDMVVSVQGDVVSTIEIDSDDFVISQNRPNPASDFTIIELDNISNLQNANLIIHNAVGQQVYNAPVASDLQTVKLNTANWNTGIYFYRVETGEEVTKTLRMEVVR